MQNIRSFQRSAAISVKLLSNRQPNKPFPRTMALPAEVMHSQESPTS